MSRLGIVALLGALATGCGSTTTNTYETIVEPRDDAGGDAGAMVGDSGGDERTADAGADAADAASCVGQELVPSSACGAYGPIDAGGCLANAYACPWVDAGVVTRPQFRCADGGCENAICAQCDSPGAGGHVCCNVNACVVTRTRGCFLGDGGAGELLSCPFVDGATLQLIPPPNSACVATGYLYCCPAP